MDYGVCSRRLVHGNIEGFDMMCGVVQVILTDEKLYAKERYRKCTLCGWKARFERMQAKAMQILATESVHKLEGTKSTRAVGKMT